MEVICWAHVVTMGLWLYRVVLANFQGIETSVSCNDVQFVQGDVAVIDFVVDKVMMALIFLQAPVTCVCACA